jgi:hypothetical protein
MSFMDKVNMEYDPVDNKKDIECLLIKKGSVDHISYGDLDYLSQLLKLDLFETIIINKDNFIEEITTKLDIKNYNHSNIHVLNEVVSEEPNYVYELMYVAPFDKNYDKEKFHTEENYNGMATLININGDKVYSNAILFKNYVPSLSNSMYLKDITKNDLFNILHDRVFTKVVVYNGMNDNLWKEQTVIGDMASFAKEFFEEETYYKLEIPFLMHNINIWYNVCKYNGKYDLCGKIIDKQVENCIWFTMKNDEYRGNITLDEVNKIIHLSKLLDTYQTPDQFYEEKFDNIGRKIIYNKYKVLDYMYKYPLASSSNKNN